MANRRITAPDLSKPIHQGGTKEVTYPSLLPPGWHARSQFEQDPAFVERYCKRTFLGRMADNTDVKGAIAYLALDASAYVTGTILPIDGGYMSAQDARQIVWQTRFHPLGRLPLDGGNADGAFTMVPLDAWRILKN